MAPSMHGGGRASQRGQPLLGRPGQWAHKTSQPSPCASALTAMPQILCANAAGRRPLHVQGPHYRRRPPEARTASRSLPVTHGPLSSPRHVGCSALMQPAFVLVVLALAAVGAAGQTSCTDWTITCARAVLMVGQGIVHCGNQPGGCHCSTF